MFRKLFGLGLVALLGASSLRAQYIPVVAKVRDTAEVMLNGKITETHIREGVFFRTSNGSELRRWTTLDGRPVKGDMALGSLLDTEKNVNYAVNYQRREAHVRTLPSITPPQQSDSGESSPLGEKTVQGVICTLSPVYLLEQGSPPKLYGRRCYSEEYELDLQMETTTGPKTATGETVHQSTELHDLEIGTEPDPNLFDLKDFTIYKPEPKK